MNKIKYKKPNAFIKVLSIILCLVLFPTPVVSADFVPILDGTNYYIESCNISGLIEPVTSNSGAYVFSNGFNNTDLKHWEFERYLENFTAYYKIKSSKGENLYLRYVDTNNTYNITVDSIADTENPSDDFLWKLTRLDSCAFYDLYTISSKKDPTKYLTTVGSYLDVVSGLGNGREQATRYWKLHDPTESVKKIKTSHKTNGDSNVKPIILASTYDNYRSDRYFGSYINDDVIGYCENISNANIYEYDRFNNRGLLELISQSSFCVISTHGRNNSILCQDYENNNETLLYMDYIKDQIPDGYLNNTRFVLLLACETASTSTTSNIAHLLREKGVETVVAFEESILFAEDEENGAICPGEASMLYARIFLSYLSVGETVRNAVSLTYSDINDRYKDEEFKEEVLKKFVSGYYNLDSAVIYGNENLTFNI